ncbi:MAG: hypothetical protein ACRCYO_17810 [Bacteroidia bacterium]
MRKRNNKSLLYFLLLLLAACNSPQTSVTGKSVATTQQELAQALVKTDTSQINGNTYTRFLLSAFTPKLSNKRPVQTDTNLVFAIACAFTRLDNNAIDGVFIERGKIIQSQLNTTLGGLLLLYPKTRTNAERIEIRKRESNEFESPQSLKRFLADSVSCCQQIQLIRDKLPLRFGKDKALFQRRALVTFPTGKVEVIESQSAILLQTFADDLAALGAENALYTDMGGWDEGWYKPQNNTNIEVIGQMRSHTNRQSNWLVFIK